MTGKSISSDWARRFARLPRAQPWSLRYCAAGTCHRWA